MPGIPVKLLKSREEDMTNGVYHPVHAMQADRRTRQGQQPCRPATPEHLRSSRSFAYASAGSHEGGADPAVFQGLNPGGAEGAFGYDIPNTSSSITRCAIRMCRRVLAWV